MISLRLQSEGFLELDSQGTKTATTARTRPASSTLPYFNPIGCGWETLRLMFKRKVVVSCNFEAQTCHPYTRTCTVMVVRSTTLINNVKSPQSTAAAPRLTVQKCNEHLRTAPPPRPPAARRNNDVLLVLLGWWNNSVAVLVVVHPTVVQSCHNTWEQKHLLIPGSVLGHEQYSRRDEHGYSPAFDIAPGPHDHFQHERVERHEGDIVGPT